MNLAKGQTHRVIRNFSSLILAQIIYKLLTFFIMILVARSLGVEEFGKLSFGLSFVWIFLFLSDLGFSELFVRDVAFNKALLKKYTDNMTAIKIVLSLIAYLILLIVGRFSSGNDVVKFWIISILGLSVILDSFVYYLRTIFRINNTLQYEALLVIIEAVIKFAFIYISLIYNPNKEKLVILSLAFLVVSFCNLFINLSVFFRQNNIPTLRFDKKLWIYLVKSGFPFALVYILSLINFRVDVLMLSIFRGDIEAGIFSADFRLIEQFLLLPAILSYVALPEFLRLSKSINGMHNLAYRLIFISVFVSFVIIILGSIFSNTIISIIYGQKFLQAAVYFRVLILILPFFFTKVIIEKMLYSFGKQLSVSFVYCACVLLNIALNFITIPRFGIFGVSINTISCEVLMMVGIFICLKKYSSGELMRNITLGFTITPELLDD